MSEEHEKQPDDGAGDQVDQATPEGEVEVDLLALREEISEHETPPGDGEGDGVEGEYIPGGESRHDVNVAMIAMALEQVFNILAIVRGPHWKLKRGEAKNAAEPLDAVIKKYFGDQDVGPEVAAAIAFAGIVLPRYLQDTGVDLEEGTDNAA